MKTTLISFLFIAMGGIISPLYAAVPTSPPSSSTAPNGGWFSQYFTNLGSNPCATGRAITGYSSLFVPQCSFLFWILNAAGEIEYTGNSRIIGNLSVNNLNVGGTLTSSNLTTSSINSVSVSNFVTTQNMSPLTPGYLPKAISSLAANTLGDSLLFENAGNIGIGTTTPGARLELKGATDNLLRLTQTDPADGWNYIEWNSNAGRRWWMGTDSNGIFNIGRDGANGTFARINNAGLIIDGNTVANGNVGIGTDTPTQKLDVDGSVRIRGGAGSGKILMSDINGVARWEAVNLNPSGVPNGYQEKNWNLDEDTYGGWTNGSQTDTCGNGDAEFTCGASQTLTCRDRYYRAPSGWTCDVGCWYTDPGEEKYRTVSCVQATLLVKVGYSCSPSMPACSYNGQCSLTQGTPSAQNQGWVKGAASCGFTCTNGYSGANCEIPPCEQINIFFPPYETTTPFAPTNPKNTQLFLVSLPHSDSYARAFLCEPSPATNTEKYNWVNGRAWGHWRSPYPVPNVGGNYTDGYGYIYHNTPGNYGYENPYSPPPPCDSCGA